MLFSNQLKTLQNVIKNFNIKSVFTTKERDEIILSMGNLIDNFIMNDPLGYSSPYFDENLKEYVFKNMLLTLNELFVEDELLKDAESELQQIYKKTHKIYFSQYYPLRSYEDTFIRKVPNVVNMKKKIEYIENIPQPEQRTPEWYNFRHNLITASSAWKVFKSQSSINQLVVEKCKPLSVEKYNYVNTNTPMHHGNKYEDISIMLYENMYNTTIKDFGCIKHPIYNFLGASPDGINVKEDSHLYGRMLEIKNPTTRELTGIPKEDYWIQMQLQMETCNLNECDFLETVFKEYEDEEEFIKDGSFTYSSEEELKGIIIYFMKEGKPHYEYMPLYISKTEYEKWEEKIMEKNRNLTWVKNIYWRLEDYSCVLVLRNKLWFNNSIKKIEEVWNTIEKDRVDGYEHRLPKKQSRGSRSNSLVDAEENSNGKKANCLIDTDGLHNQIIYIDT